MEEELETKLLVDVARLDPEGETLEGEVDIIDLDEPFVKPFGGVRYRLTAQLDLVCSRCGETFDTTIKVDDFTASVEVSEKQDFADLTTDARESIILALPTYPLCDEDCPGIAQKVERPADDRWGALDGLKVD